MLRKNKSVEIKHYESAVRTPEKTLFIGDSNMEQYYPRIQKIFDTNKKARSFIFVTGGSCPPIKGIVRNGHHKNCQKVIETALKLARSPDIVRIVFAAQWTTYFAKSTEYFAQDEGLRTAYGSQGYSLAIENFKQQLAELQSKKKITLVLNIPVGEAYDPLSTIQRTLLGGISKTVEKASRKEFEKTYPFIFDLARIGQEAGISVVNPLDYLCQRDQCITNIAGIPVYKDISHLRPFYVETHIQYLDESLF